MSKAAAILRPVARPEAAQTLGTPRREGGLPPNGRADLIRDTVPIASIADAPYLLLVNKNFPARTLPEFIAYARANPGRINVAAANKGSAGHVFGELFRMLSYEKIGTSTIQSRATAGVAGGTYLFALPGSPSACRDAWDDILVHQLDYRFKPCNFVELMPRLMEK